MADLKTKYMGLSLRSPLIVSSSGLTNSADKIRKIEEYGAGAVVLKSLFEEQISHEAGHYLENSVDGFPEAVDYVMNYVRNNSVDDYLTLIEESVKSVKIPVIASINCVNPGEWIDFARKIEDAGASAIELNINIIPVSTEVSSAQIEKIYFSIIEQVKKKLNIPISVKIGYHFTNLLYLIKQMIIRDVNSVTLFNRFYEPDISPEGDRTGGFAIFSTPADIRHSLRWVGLVTGLIEGAEVSASTGVHGGLAAVKMLLAGAASVQVCSTLYRNGLGQIKTMNNEILDWMEKHDYKSISDFRGKMNYRNIGNPQVYERSQFMKYFSSVE